MLGGSFQIGRSALAAYQAAINIAGQNIANVGNPDYTRQTGRLAAELGGPRTGGVAPGGGVRLAQLRRHIDESLENRLRQALGHRNAADIIHRSLAETEVSYNELSDADISTQLSEFFAAFSQLETGPQDSSTRDLLLSKAEQLLRSVHRQRDGLIRQVEGLNEEATAAKVRDGWLHTGDQAEQDEDGYITFVGRDDDVISSAGYRIGPGPIEECLIRHPAVSLAAVIGSPDEERGEIVKAFVVAAPGVAVTDALTRELQAYVRERLSAYEYPRAVAFVDELPTTVTGKIRRGELRRLDALGG